MPLLRPPACMLPDEPVTAATVTAAAGAGGTAVPNCRMHALIAHLSANLAHAPRGHQTGLENPRHPVQRVGPSAGGRENLIL